MNDPVRRRMLENLQRDQERSDQARHASAKGDDRTGPVETVLLDRAGVIVAVNDAWRAFGEDNEGDPARSNVGVSYLAACDDASDDADVRQVAVAIRAATGRKVGQ